MERDLLKGICIGLLFGLPAGAAGAALHRSTDPPPHGPRMAF